MKQKLLVQPAFQILLEIQKPKATQPAIERGMGFDPNLVDYQPISSTGMEEFVREEARRKEHQRQLEKAEAIRQEEVQKQMELKRQQEFQRQQELQKQQELQDLKRQTKV